ncbi:mechanosensitive ion channel family protein [Candidatus Latescibacterota bacterium]
MYDFTHSWLVNQGIDTTIAFLIERLLAVVLVILLSVIANIIAKRFIIKAISHLIAHTKTKWDDILLKRKFFNQLSHFAPALVIYFTAPFILDGYDNAITFITNVVIIYMIILSILVINSFLAAVLNIYRTFDIAKEIPLKGFIQIIQIAIVFIGGIFVLSNILNKTPLYLLSGLGAITAVLMLIFKDSILGFVAGIQLISNKMVARGDWIEMPQYGADGDVLDVTLTTVKVSNWDKTITTIPTYALISESFKNWRGMTESGGRRIKRSIYLDMNLFKFCTEEMLSRFSTIQYISEYIARKREEISEYNKAHEINNSNLVNGRHLTNIGTFRAYVHTYLRNHPMINQEMTFLVRQLALTEHGLPIEIYVFCKDKVWANYEAIQSDIFDHLLAIIPEFDLKIFQNPSGGDFKEFIAKCDLAPES